jgi:hypothetical protein
MATENIWKKFALEIEIEIQIRFFQILDQQWQTDENVL